MVRPLCSLWCSCGFHVHRTPHFRSFQYTTIYDVDLRLFELKSWCSRVMLHSLHTFGGSWHENLSAEFEVSFVMLNREDEDGFKRPMGLEYPSCRGWRWNHSDMGRIGPVEIASHLKDRLVTSHFKLEGGLGGTGWEQTLIRLCITHCLYFDNIMINYV